MARINTYPPDAILQDEDLIVGSDYKGHINGIPKYETKSFSLFSLANYLARFAANNGDLYDLGNYFSNFGEFDANGNLISMSEAFANLTISTTTSARFAQAQYVLNLGASVGLFDPDGNLTQLSTAFADQVITATASDRFAQTQFVTNLAASFGTYDADGNILSYSNSTFLSSITNYVDANSASAQKIENLNTTLQLLDENGNPIFSNAEYLEEITLHVDANSASAAIARGLNSEFGITDADGNIVKTKAEFDEEVSQYVDANSATANIATRLNTEFGIVDPETGETVKSKAQFDEEVSQYVDANSATANIATKLNTEFGIVDPETGETVKTKAQFDEEVSQYVDANSATANIATKLNTEFGIVDPATGETVKTGAEYLDEVTQHVDDNSATASKVTNLNSTLDILNADGTVKKNSAQFLQDITTHVDENSATAGLVESLEVTVGNIPLIFRQDDPPSLTETPIGSLWFDTNDNNKGYILVAGDPNVWTIVEDTEFTQFKSTYEEIINNTATESSATATKTTNLNAILEILDENGNLIPQSQSDYFDTITNYVDANSAVAEKAETLRVAIEGDGVTPGISATLTETSEAVASKPNVYRQTTEPTAPEGETIPIKSVWYDTDDNNKPYVYDGSPAAWVEARDGKVLELETYARAQKTIEADANGVVTGITVKSENSGDPDTAISDITFKTNTFNIVDQNDVTRLAFDQTGLFINGSGNFTGDITGASGTFGGSLNVNGNFLVNTAGSVQIKGGDTLGDSRFEILDDSGNSKYRLYGGGINLNSWTGDNALSGGQIQFGGVAHMYSGNGTTTTSNHHMVLDVYGGSKKLFLKADEITLRKSTTTGGSHTTIIEGDLEVQGSVSFSSGASTSDTTYDIRSVTTTGGALLRLTGSDSTTDDVKFASSGSVTVSYTNDNTIQIHGVDTDTNTQRTDEEIRDLVAGFIQAGNNVSVAHDDGANTFTINATDTNTQRSDEEIRDVIAPFVVGGTYISVAHDDAANTLTISHSDTSSQASVNNSNGNVIQDVTLDSRGHVTGLASTNLDNRYLRTSVDGQVSGTITATDFILSSDQRLKSDINTYTPQPINIKYRDYLINNGGDRRRVGVIAQELEKDHPEFVMTNPDTGMKAVSYIDMLVAKVAELEERIKQLENGGA